MSKVIPAKMANFGKAPKGVMNMRDVEYSMVRLLPNNASSTQEYTPSATNRISFRIPNYANSFLDNSRSFISYKFVNTTSGTTTTGADRANCKLVDYPGAWIHRLVVKSNGLTIEDTTNFNLLAKLLKLMDVRDERGKTHLGDYSANAVARANALFPNDPTEQMQVAIAEKQSGTAGGQYYVFEFETGVLSKHLRSYLPLHLMSHSASALDIDIYLAQPIDCMQFVRTGAGNSVGITPNYRIEDVVYNLCLVKVDESLAKKFNSIGSSETEDLVIPFETFRNHTATSTAMRQTLFVSEACTDLKRLYVIWKDHTNALQVGGEPNAFLGSVRNVAANGAALGKKITSYNVRVGNKYVWNEAVEETRNNNISLAHFINAHYLGADDNMLYVQKVDPSLEDSQALFESGRNFALAANLTYSEENEKGVIQGINTGGLPVQVEVKFDTTPNLSVHSFAQCGYELHIKHGQVSYVEVRSGDDTSY